MGLSASPPEALVSAVVSAHQPSGGGGTRAKGGARGCGGRAVPATQQSELRLARGLEAGGRRTTPPLQFEGDQPQGYAEGSWGQDRRQLYPAGSVVTWERFAGTGVSEGSAERREGGAAGRRSHWPWGHTGRRRGPETLQSLANQDRKPLISQPPPSQLFLAPIQPPSRSGRKDYPEKESICPRTYLC